MADTGFISPGAVDGTYVSGLPWDEPNNVKVIGGDPQYSTWSGPKFDEDQPGEGPELRCTNFGFNIPAGNVIIGIEAKIFGHTSGNPHSELAYVTTDGTSVNGDYKRNDWTELTFTDTIHVYGSSTDKWDGALTWDVVNASTFGWIFMIYDDVNPLAMLIDYMQMKIYYEPPPPIIIAMGT
jgi:hypothetical protein